MARGSPVQRIQKMQWAVISKRAVEGGISIPISIDISLRTPLDTALRYPHDIALRSPLDIALCSPTRYSRASLAAFDLSARLLACLHASRSRRSTDLHSALASRPDSAALAALVTHHHLSTAGRALLSVRARCKTTRRARWRCGV